MTTASLTPSALAPPPRSAPRRVALLTWDFPPVPTGLGQAASEIAHGLVGEGVQVTVFTLDRTGIETLEGGALTVHGCAIEDGSNLARLRKRMCAGHFAVPAAFRRAVLAAHRERPFDIVEATNWYAPAALLPADLSAPLVVRCSTPAIDAFDHGASWRDRTDLKFAHWLETRTVRGATALISNTAHHRKTVDEVYGLSGSRLHETIALSLPDALLERGARARPASATGGPVFLFVGRAERRKGFDEALGAVAILANRARACGAPLPRLITVGLAPGDLERRCAALGLAADLSGLVTDLGRAKERDLHAAYEACHMVLAPSRYESYGIVYREACAFGRPFVGSADDPSARELVAETPCGKLAAATEPAALAETAQALWADADDRAHRGRAGLAHARTLSRQALGRRTLSVYTAARAARTGETVAAPTGAA
ncbi:MAG: glycosyltransferase family 4 protein [Oceanicaulis sp.]